MVWLNFKTEIELENCCAIKINELSLRMYRGGVSLKKKQFTPDYNRRKVENKEVELVDYNLYRQKQNTQLNDVA